jgi:signal transduction histidine kinase
VVHVEVESADGALRVSVRDDGAGGADPARGSGLVGLRDRVEALGGAITIQSPLGAGTSVDVELPISD